MQAIPTLGLKYINRAHFGLCGARGLHGGTMWISRVWLQFSSRPAAMALVRVLRQQLKTSHPTHSAAMFVYTYIHIYV